MKTVIDQGIFINQTVHEKLIYYPKWGNQLPQDDDEISQGKIEIIEDPQDWTFKESIFHTYRNENLPILQDCFKIDWERFCGDSMIKYQKDAQTVKEFLT